MPKFLKKILAYQFPVSLLILLVVFLSLNEKSFHYLPLSNSSYSLSNTVDRVGDQLPRVIDLDNGEFFMQPLNNQHTETEINLNQRGHVFLLVSLRSGAKNEFVHFKVTKNNQQLSQRTLKALGYQRFIPLMVEPGDRLGIVAVADNTASGNWEIYVKTMVLYYPEVLLLCVILLFSLTVFWFLYRQQRGVFGFSVILLLFFLLDYFLWERYVFPLKPGAQNEYTQLARQNTKDKQQESMRLLSEKALLASFFPHRVNTKEKLADIWQSGARAFEVDVHFDAVNGQQFYVGHDADGLGEEFSHLLESVPHKEIQRIWFDFKNLNAENHLAVLAELNRLDQLYQLKEKIILESGWQDSRFSLFSDAGWHTSYYLPRRDIVTALRYEKEDELRVLAKQISMQVNLQKVSAVSFEYQAYPFVKIYLEPLINDSIVYHTWGAPNFSKTQFVQGIEESVFYKDQRLQTLIGGFQLRY